MASPTSGSMATSSAGGCLPSGRRRRQREICAGQELGRGPGARFTKRANSLAGALGEQSRNSLGAFTSSGLGARTIALARRIVVGFSPPLSTDSQRRCLGLHFLPRPSSGTASPSPTCGRPWGKIRATKVTENTENPVSILHPRFPILSPARGTPSGCADLASRLANRVRPSARARPARGAGGWTRSGFIIVWFLAFGRVRCGSS